MTALMKIQSFIQAYVKAIASILDVDVTIVDNELVRVAGTGIYADEIGETVTHANFFHHILVSGESGSIMDSMADLNCKGCEKRTTFTAPSLRMLPILFSRRGLWSVSFPSLPSARGNEKTFWKTEGRWRNF